MTDGSVSKPGLFAGICSGPAASEMITGLFTIQFANQFTQLGEAISLGGRE